MIVFFFFFFCCYVRPLAMHASSLCMTWALVLINHSFTEGWMRWYIKCQRVLTAGIEFVKTVMHAMEGSVIAKVAWWFRLWDAALVRLWKGRVLEMPGMDGSQLYHHHMQCLATSWAAYCACMSACLWNLNWMASERIGTTLFSSTYIILLCLLVFGSEWDYQQTKILYIGELYAV